MRFMIIVKATAESEAGIMPTERLLTEMGNYNAALVKAGIMQAGECLHPSSKGPGYGSRARNVQSPTARSRRRGSCPNPFEEGESEIEVRQFEAEDFGAEFTPELRAQEGRLRDEMASR